MTSNLPEILALLGPSVLEGVPVGPKTRVFIVDPANSNAADTNSGLHPDVPLASVPEGEDRCVSGQHDVVLLIGSDTADTLAAALTWDKSYTHLKGVSGPLPGEGQRCRVIGGSTTDLTSVITVSGTGCYFANLKIANEADANQDAGAVVVSGSRNVFRNVQIAGMLHATPGARAGCYSLNVSGSENLFERCTIGADTITRAEANADLLISGGARNRFWNCEIISQSDTAGHFAVSITDMDRYLEFKDCKFYNFSVNWATSLTDAIHDAETATHYVILRGNCVFIGFTGISDAVTHVYGAGPAPDAGMFLATNPTG
jgi:hypothetical protein